MSLAAVPRNLAISNTELAAGEPLDDVQYESTVPGRCRSGGVRWKTGMEYRKWLASVEGKAW